MKAQSLLTAAALAACVASVACGKKHKETVSGEVAHKPAECPQFLNGPWTYSSSKGDHGFTGVIDGKNPVQFIDDVGTAYVIDGTTRKAPNGTSYSGACSAGKLTLNYTTAADAKDTQEKEQVQISTASNALGSAKFSKQTLVKGKPAVDAKGNSLAPVIETAPMSRPGASKPDAKGQVWAAPQDPSLGTAPPASGEPKAEAPAAPGPKNDYSKTTWAPPAEIRK